MRRPIAALTSVLLLAACATLPEEAADYPPSLDRPTRSEAECPDISGVYRSMGTRINADGSRTSANMITDVLQLNDGLQAEVEVRLTLLSKRADPLGGLLGQYVAAKLAVEGRSGARWEEPTWGAAACINGTLYFPSARQRAGIGGVPGLIVSHGEAAHLFNAQDGSLIAIRSVVDAGIAVLVPWYQRRSSYFVFPKAEGTPWP